MKAESLKPNIIVTSNDDSMNVSFEFNVTNESTKKTYNILQKTEIKKGDIIEHEKWIVQN